MIKEKSVETWSACIYIAGPIHYIEQICRHFVLEGQCVNVMPVRYIFRGGSEDGARIGFIQYPRFPQREEHLRDEVLSLAKTLLRELAQLSCSVMFPDEIVYLYKEEKESPDRE